MRVRFGQRVPGGGAPRGRFFDGYSPNGEWITREQFVSRYPGQCDEAGAAAQQVCPVSIIRHHCILLTDADYFSTEQAEDRTRYRFNFPICDAYRQRPHHESTGQAQRSR